MTRTLLTFATSSWIAVATSAWLLFSASASALDRPLEWNGYVPAVNEVYEIILPGSGDQLRAGYNGEVVDSTCDFTFDSSDDTRAEIETHFENDGPQFCLPLDTDWNTAKLRIDIDGIDCIQLYGERCWIKPTDILTRDKTARRMPNNPELWELRFINGSSHWGIVGLEFDGRLEGPTNYQVWVGDGAGDEEDDIVIAYSLFTGWGSGTNYNGTKAAVNISDATNTVFHENVCHSSATAVTSPTEEEQDYDCLRIAKARDDPRPLSEQFTYYTFNTCYDTGAGCIVIDQSGTAQYQVPNLRVISNDLFRSGAYRNLATGTGGPPYDGQGPYDCYEDILDFKNGGDPDNYAIIRNNSLHGARDNDPACDGSGAAGQALTMHFRAGNALITGNRFYDNVRTFQWPNNTLLVGEDESVDLTGNFFEIVDGTLGFPDPGTYSTYNPSRAYEPDSKSPGPDRFAFNTVVCTNLPAAAPVPISEPIEGNETHENKGNIYFDCPQLDALSTTTLTTWGYNNAYVSTALNPANAAGTRIDDTANRDSYGDFTFDDRLCHHWDGACPQRTYLKVIPPQGGPLDNALTPVWVATAGLQAPGHVPIQKMSGSQDGTYGAFEAAGIAGFQEIRVNVGGPSYVDVDSDTWQACNAAGMNPCNQISIGAGGIFTDTTPPAGTLDPEIFQSIIASFPSGNSIVGAFSVPDGDYLLRLLFTEIVETYGATDRVFEIRVEGILEESAFDIVAQAGAPETAYIYEIPLAITDGAINFELRHGTAENPVLSGVEIVVDQTAPSGTLPYGLNGILPAAAHVRPVNLPALNDVCRTGYNCPNAPSTCTFTFTGSEAAGVVSAALNNVANGNVFCVPVTADWTGAGFDIVTNRDCSSGGCWLVNANIDTLLRNAKLTSAPRLNSLKLDTGAHGWGIVGLRFDNTSKTNAGDLLEIEDGVQNPIVAFNWFHQVGNSLTSSGAAAISLGDSVEPIVYSNIIEGSELRPGINLAGVSGSPTSPFIHRNTYIDLGGPALLLSSTTTDAKVVHNHAYETGVNRLGPADTAPQGFGSRSCSPGGFVLRGTGGVAYGNLMHGYRPHRAECAAVQGTGEAMKFDILAEGWDIYWNAFWDTYRGIAGGTAGAGTGNTISGNVVELEDGSGGDSWDAFGIGTDGWGGEEQIYARNTINCASLPVSGDIEPYRGSAALYDMRYNFMLRCDAPGTQTGGASFLNVYASNGIAPHETPDYDDTASIASYTDFWIYAELCEHSLMRCKTKKFEKIVPPVGGAVDDRYPSPTFTPGRGASAPKEHWAQ